MPNRNRIDVWIKAFLAQGLFHIAREAAAIFLAAVLLGLVCTGGGNKKDSEGSTPTAVVVATATPLPSPTATVEPTPTPEPCPPDSNRTQTSVALLIDKTGSYQDFIADGIAFAGDFTRASVRPGDRLWAGWIGHDSYTEPSIVDPREFGNGKPPEAPLNSFNKKAKEAYEKELAAFCVRYRKTKEDIADVAALIEQQQPTPEAGTDVWSAISRAEQFVSLSDSKARKAIVAITDGIDTIAFGPNGEASPGPVPDQVKPTTLEGIDVIFVQVTSASPGDLRVHEAYWTSELCRLHAKSVQFLSVNAGVAPSDVLDGAPADSVCK